jgi:VWFA-related protein
MHPHIAVVRVGNTIAAAFRLSMFLTTILFALLAQTQTKTSASGQEIFRAQTNLVFLPTQVQNRKGEIVYGLKAGQFLVEDNGVRRQVEVDEDPESLGGLSLAVVVQCSRSAPQEFDKLKGLGSLIEAIAGDAPHEAAVMSYGEAPHVLSDFSADPEAWHRAMAKLKPCGNFYAASIDAVYYAINMLNHRHTRYRRAVLLISETRDHGSRSKLHEVVAELGITDTVIYSVAFSPAKNEFVNEFRRKPEPHPVPKKRPPSPAEEPPNDPVITEHTPAMIWPPQLMAIINALRQNSASELAALSGGEYVNFTTRRGFDNALGRISNRIHNYYLLRFLAPSDNPILELHNLQVRVDGYPDAVIRTRRSYWSGIFE